MSRQARFFLTPSQAKYLTRACHQPLTRHFVGPPPAIFIIPTLLPPPLNLLADSYGASQSEPWQLREPIRTPGSYGAANQNAPFNDLITPSTNQSAPFPHLGPRLWRQWPHGGGLF